MNIDYKGIDYQPDAISTGIVHLGLGAFMRSHLAVYTNTLMNQDQASCNWGICAANLRSNESLVKTLKDQDFQYHVAEYSDRDNVTLREIASVRDALYTGGNQGRAELLARLQNPAIRIVTLTVTEKGYYLNPADGTLLEDDPALKRDLAQPDSPSTPVGIICCALARRQKNRMKPFTVLSCDNLPHNGKNLKTALLAYAGRAFPDLVSWLENEVHCPSTMVDRIVPAMTEKSLDDVNALIFTQKPGSPRDRAAVVCEAFTQWVIEDDFSDGRPDWNKAGAQFVADVTPFETMKIRMLNGSHSLLAYLGFLAGYETVSDCMQNSVLRTLLRQYWQHEAIPALNMPEEVNLLQYADSLLSRFSNDSLQHRTKQIAMDGSLKIPQRWLEGAVVILKQNRNPEITALGIAAWIRYCEGVDEQGNTYELDDPMADTLQNLLSLHTKPEDKVEAILQTAVFSGYSINTFPDFIHKICGYLFELNKYGAEHTMSLLLSKSTIKETDS